MDHHKPSQRRNAVRPQTYAELRDAFQRAAVDEATGFVVLTGAGAGFCAGDDFQEIFLSESRGTTGSPVNFVATAIGKAHNPCSLEIVGCEKPVIAAVNGAAVGMGFDLAVVCDIRIASEQARFGFLLCATGRARNWWAATIPAPDHRPFPGMELALSGALIDAAQADRIGLVSRVVVADQLVPAVEAMIQQLSWGAPLAQRAIKRVMIRGLSMEWTAFDEYIAPLSGRAVVDRRPHGGGHFARGATAAELQGPVRPARPRHWSPMSVH